MAEYLLSQESISSLLDATKWRASNGADWTSYTPLVTYVVSVCWMGAFSAHVRNLFGGSVDTSWTVQFYDPLTEGMWNTAVSESLSARGNSRDHATYFYHNLSTSGTSTADQRWYHLWKITNQVTWSQNSNWYTNLSLYLGGIERMTETEFTAVCKNEFGKEKPVRGIKPMIYRIGARSDGENVSYRPTEADIIAEYTSNPLRGTEIGIASGTFKYCC